MSNEPTHTITVAGQAISKKMFWLCIVTFTIPVVAISIQLAFDHWGERTLADGPIMPVALTWYIVSNYLCANAVYLYAKHTPLSIKVACWIGLMGGGTDHVVEAWQWFNGTHAGFAEHWEAMGWGWFPFVAFGVTSLAGIFAVVYEFVRYEDKASTAMKTLMVFLTFMGVFYTFYIDQQFVVLSSIVWHIGHIFITHMLLSMIPAFIVWAYASHLDLFTFLPRRSAHTVRAVEMVGAA
ncbi:MAG: hypothetical protein AAGF11_28510 [Myxococcota bacterium]